MARPDYDKAITLVAMETGWSLEYIQALEFSVFWAFHNNVLRLIAEREYRRDRVVAASVAVHLKDVSIEDLIGPPPWESKVLPSEEEVTIWQLAESMGIRPPAHR